MAVVMNRAMVGVEAGYILIGEYCIVLKTTLLHGVRELDRASGRDTTLLCCKPPTCLPTSRLVPFLPCGELTVSFSCSLPFGRLLTTCPDFVQHTLFIRLRFFSHSQPTLHPSQPRIPLRPTNYYLSRMRMMGGPPQSTSSNV